MRKFMPTIAKTYSHLSTANAEPNSLECHYSAEQNSLIIFDDFRYIFVYLSWG